MVNSLAEVKFVIGFVGMKDHHGVRVGVISVFVSGDVRGLCGEEIGMI